MLHSIAVSCVRGSRPLLQCAEHTCFRAVVRSGREVPVNLSFTRSFRLFPRTPASMRNRFGRSQMKDQESHSNFQSGTLDAGRAAIAAGAAVGLGALCYYGFRAAPITSADSLSALDRASVWPEYVRQRIQATYAYLAGGATIAAGAAVTLARSPAFCRLMLGSGMLAPIGMMLASMGMGVVCQMIPYPQSGGISGKHVAWALFSASIGGMLVPVCLMGGPIVTRAVMYTGGIVASLSTVALSAPSDRFLKWGGPLAIGLGVVFVSSLGSMFLSPVSRLGSGLYVISLYGGLLLFSGFLLYDTQLVIHRAENHPPPNAFDRALSGGLPVTLPRPFDPINNSIHILLDAVNIFVRLVAIFGGGGQRRK